MKRTGLKKYEYADVEHFTSKPGLREIRELCTTKLAERAVPYYFEFIDELPMTMMGKVDYRKLEREY